MTDDELTTSNSTDNQSVTPKRGKRQAADDMVESGAVGGRYLTADRRRLIAQLAADGLSIPEIVMLAQCTPSQAQRWAIRGRELVNKRADSVIIQRIANQSTISQRLGGYAEESALKVLKKINETIESTNDLGKLSAALKALVQIADGNKVTTTISQTVSRLRGHSTNTNVSSDIVTTKYTDSGYIRNLPTANDTQQDYTAGEDNESETD